ncbi:MAG: hypothetical protein J6Z38_05235 [Lachnospiraceae bacterium]|nr:hypothetical protein [Lachnospiraceae bacterium]
MAGLFRFTAEYEGEELRGASDGRQPRRMPRGLLVLILLILIAGGVMVGAYLLKAEHITVSGNRYCNDDIVISKVFREEDDYRLSTILYRMVAGVPNDGAFESIRVSLTGLQSAAVKVIESKPVAQVLFRENYVFLNESGIVVGSLPVADAELLWLDGTFFTDYADFSFPSTDDPDALLDALSVAKEASGKGLKPSGIRCEYRTYSLFFKDVEVRIGTTENLSGKLSEIVYQLPKYEGLKGILHMEDYDGKTEKPYFYFEVLK